MDCRFSGPCSVQTARVSVFCQRWERWRILNIWPLGWGHTTVTSGRTETARISIDLTWISSSLIINQSLASCGAVELSVLIGRKVMIHFYNCISDSSVNALIFTCSISIATTHTWACIADATDNNGRVESKTYNRCYGEMFCKEMFMFIHGRSLQCQYKDRRVYMLINKLQIVILGKLCYKSNQIPPCRWLFSYTRTLCRVVMCYSSHTQVHCRGTLIL